jgi:hypothetical protein
MSEKLVLPRVYSATLEKFEKYNSQPKLSYSQYSSWSDPLYKNQYILGYMFGIRDEGNVWSFFGGQCGEYIESGGEIVGDMLLPVTIKTLNTVPRPENALYEYETIIPREGYVLQGFLDQCFDNKLGTTVLDFKTGNKKSKVEYYGSDKYQQTTTYSYYLDKYENKKIHYSGVTLMHRSGNGFSQHPIRLDGEIIDIPTPYSRERAEKFLLEVDRTAKEISDMYKVFLKVNN